MALDAGELVGYIGPNGAGKSTTIKMLTGILVPTSGIVRIDGLVPYEQRAQRAQHRRGVRSALATVLGSAADRDVRAAARDLRHPAARYHANLDHFTETLDMAPFLAHAGAPALARTAHARRFRAAMLHDPRIVFLDEPTIGLDVVAKEAIREFIARVNRERGTTFILTTHDLADVERLCRRIVLIDRGTLVYDGEIDALRDRYGTHRTLV